MDEEENDACARWVVSGRDGLSGFERLLAFAVETKTLVFLHTFSFRFHSVSCSKRLYCIRINNPESASGEMKIIQNAPVE